ncbi:MAG: NAD kinase [Bacteroidales bacterium]|nr:NAD kinase [Bacteroidales bacterium]
MMKVAIYGKIFSPGFFSSILQVFDLLVNAGAEVIIYKPFLEYIHGHGKISHEISDTFFSPDDFLGDIDLMVSIGGDGTFLETIPFALRNNIPVIGLNSGRLGFLANIARDEIAASFQAIFNKNYEIEYRTLIKVQTPADLIGNHNFALNEITIQKVGSSMIMIDTFLNGEFLNTYWTDGLIVSTPTGSTAYSLSVGGPIVMPGSGNLILAPIASHNLTVRPIIIPDHFIIGLKASSRHERLQVTADNRTFEVKQPVHFEICRAGFRLQMLKLPNNCFYSTLRNKLMWGADKRN